MAAKLFQATIDHKKKNLLAVVGAGHVKGMAKYLENKDFSPNSVIAELDTVPLKRSWLKYIPWVIVALICFGFFLGFQKSPELGWNLVWAMGCN